jgi:hypothetical protein
MATIRTHVHLTDCPRCESDFKRLAGHVRPHSPPRVKADREGSIEDHRPDFNETARFSVFVNIIFILINAIVVAPTKNCSLFPLRCCQSYFGKTSISDSFNRPQSRFCPRTTMHAVVPKFTELHQPAASARFGVRGRSVSSWHGMPTASVKNKHFLN